MMDEHTVIARELGWPNLTHYIDKFHFLSYCTNIGTFHIVTWRDDTVITCLECLGEYVPYAKFGAYSRRASR